ncbi:MAG TPA: hypothetical protein DCY40_05775 [Actinobacteria bacterium]|nr:hypothetical protein [Actinomycetota bacterium]
MAASGEGLVDIPGVIDDTAGPSAEPDMGPVQLAVRSRLRQGQVLHTPTQQKPFKVGRIDGDGVVLLLGKGERPVPLGWDCLEGVVPFLAERGTIDIGGRHEVAGNPGTLDEYLKGCTPVNTAGWVAVLLEEAGIVAVVRERPARVRLAAGPAASSPRSATPIPATESPSTPEELELRNEVARFEGRE